MLWRFVELLREHFGADERGVKRTMRFLPWHLNFFCRYVPLPEEQYAEQAREHPLLQSRLQAPPPASAARAAAGRRAAGDAPSAGRGAAGFGVARRGARAGAAAGRVAAGGRRSAASCACRPPRSRVRSSAPAFGRAGRRTGHRVWPSCGGPTVASDFRRCSAYEGESRPWRSLPNDGRLRSGAQGEGTPMEKRRPWIEAEDGEWLPSPVLNRSPTSCPADRSA